jgi:hypothetical protein
MVPLQVCSGSFFLLVLIRQGFQLGRKFNLLKKEKVKFSSTGADCWEIKSKCILSETELKALVPSDFHESKLKVNS